MAGDRPRIGISACLLGAAVRFDAGHKRDASLLETLGPRVEWVDVCPEVEAGFGTPRDPMQLTLRGPARLRPDGRFDTGDLALIVARTGADVTAQLHRYAVKKAEALSGAGLSGFIFKKDSPSCGMEHVKVHAAGGEPERHGRGLFADALMSRLPNLPVEDEGRLADPRLREHFIERVFAYRRLRALFDGPWSVGDLIAFHARHKLALMAHSPAAYRALGRLVAAAAPRPPADVAADYERVFTAAMMCPATPGRRANVLQHMLGYVTARLDPEARRELLARIEDHRTRQAPVAVPLALIRQHVREQHIEYLERQTYLDPSPLE